jgi:MoaA/NifB/PqqE/SkfB family radical SAM enzyme
MKEAYIHILMDCNNDCLFCSLPKKEIYLNWKQIKSKIDKYYDESYKMITFSGGEPLMHPDLLKALKYSHEKGFETRVVTNGTKLTKEKIYELVETGVKTILISIHTFNSDKAKKISDNTEYDINKIIESAKYILKLNSINLDINITINKLNYKELPQIAEKISKEFSNVHLINFNYIDMFGNTLQKNQEDIIGLKYYVAERYFIEAFRILKKNKIVFRAERIPLCYLVDFEEYSSDYNRIKNVENPQSNFVDDFINQFEGKDFIKNKSCQVCHYKKICYGLNLNYNALYGSKELYPIFHDLKN